MKRVRGLAYDHRYLLMMMLVLALCVRAAIPAGYMIAPSTEKLVEVSICHGGTGERSLATIAIPMKADSDDSGHSPDAKDTHCAFSSLAQPLLGGTPPMLLAIALAAIVLLGLAPLGRLPVAPIPYLRPPLRGPPALI